MVTVAAEGKAIAKVDNMVVFVPYVVPGDIIDIQVTRKKTVMQRVKLSGLKNIRTIGARLFANTSGYAEDVNGRFFLIPNN